MDTRTKIVSTEEALRLAEAGATVVSGFFDPLIAGHALRLQELKRPATPLLVLIATPADPILPARARAELVAGLAAVDHVAELSDGIQLRIRPQMRLEQEDQRRLDGLIEHVHKRQREASD